MKDIIAKRRAMWYGATFFIMSSLFIFLFSIINYQYYFLFALIITIPGALYHLIIILISPLDLVTFNKDTKTFIFKKNRKKWTYKNVLDVDSVRDHKKLRKINSGTLYIHLKDDTNIVLSHVDQVDKAVVQIRNIIRYYNN